MDNDARETNSKVADYELYEKTAKDYDALRFAGRSGSWGHKRQIEILKNLVPDWNGRKVLEIGCGTGRITQALAEWGAEITATDISQEMLKVARSRFDNAPDLRKPTFRFMSVFDIDIDMKEFDYVIMINVLGRLSKSKEAIKEIAVRMSPDASFCFSYPSLTSIFLPFGLLVNLRNKSLFREVTSHWYLPGTIESFCFQAGLQIVQCRGHHYVPLPGIFFFTFPFFVVWDKIISLFFPKRCASVVVVCTRKSHA